MMNEQREFDIPPRRAAVWPWVALAVLLVSLLIWRMMGAPPIVATDGQKHPAVGKPLERLKLQPLTGDAAPLELADLRGKVSLINFWGPWCPPCRIEFPHLKELEEHWRKEADFRFVSVSCSGGPGDDSEMAESTAAYLRQQRAAFPTYRDAEGTTRRAVALPAGERDVPYPTTVILGRDGTIRALWFGYRQGLEHEMRTAVEDALEVAGKP